MLTSTGEALLRILLPAETFLTGMGERVFYCVVPGFWNKVPLQLRQEDTGFLFGFLNSFDYYEDFHVSLVLNQ